MFKYGREEKLSLSSIICLIIMLFFMSSILYQIILKNVVIDVFNIRNDFVANTITSLNKPLYSPESKDVNWNQLYAMPEEKAFFQKPIQADEENVPVNVKNNIINRVYEKIKRQGENYSSKYLVFKKQFTFLSNIFNRILGMRLIQDSTGTIIFMENGHFTWEMPLIETENMAYNIKMFSEWLKSKKIDFLYVQNPGSVCKYKPEVPRGYEENSNRNVDQLLDNIIYQGGINIVDLRENLHSQNRDHYKDFFITDHHWKPHTGLWAAGEISRKLNYDYDYGIDLDLFHLNKYNLEIYPLMYGGGYEQKLTTAFTKLDDMELILPKFKTDLHIQIPTLDGVNYRGEFKDVMFDSTRWPAYNSYFYSINAITHIENFANYAVDKKILIIGDSMQDVMTPYLACGVKYVDSIDPRLFDGSIETYINETQPDIVIVTYIPTMLTKESAQSAFVFY